MNKTICAVVASIAIGFGGCGWKSQPTNQNIQQTYQTIQGKPISVDTEIYQHTKGSISTVLEVDGKKVLCSYSTNGWTNIYSLTLSNANALIQSEINDGDDELIELTGQYIGNEFKISSLKANGYVVSFR